MKRSSKRKMAAAASDEQGERDAVHAVVSDLVRTGLHGFLVGCVMRRLGGRGNPERVSDLLHRYRRQEVPVAEVQG